MDLISKYNIPAPRYTSYPTVPFWEDNLNKDKWIDLVSKSFKAHSSEGISLYIHLPYCESLCTYCACNTRITVNHAVEKPYIETLLKEWRLYLDQFDEIPVIKEIHLGGGTPTFFSAQNLGFLVSSILRTCIIAEEHDFSFEGHPSNTTREHLQTLFDLGFKRVSFGVQDFDEQVQTAINRYQSFEEVQNVFKLAREIGYTSINIDLVYGLPFQTPQSVTTTVNKVIELLPERIAFYSYAHVPWLKPGQRKFSEKDLPLDVVKRELYSIGRNLFDTAGYSDIGMDHFALKNDPLFAAQKQGRLNRNFMGYTTGNSKLLIGLGCSAISDSGTAFSQNIKTVEEYVNAVNEGNFPIIKGHILTDQDIIVRKEIMDIMCKGRTSLPEIKDLNTIHERLLEPFKDGLVELHNNELFVTNRGKQFLRNICMAFDERYWNKEMKKEIFSTTA